MTSSINKLTLAALLGVWFLAPVSGHAQSLFKDKEHMDELAKEMQVISTDITSSMDDAQSAIHKLLGEGESPSADALRQYFDDLESKARTILSRVSVNSSFMDALDAAERHLAVMQKRFEADVKAAGGEDAHALRRLERIQRSRQEFTAQMNKLRETESDIIELILQNTKSRDSLLLDGQIEDAELVADALKTVTDGLQSAADKLQEISVAALESEDVSKISTD